MVLDPSFPQPEMPRTARASAANYCYHVLNRGGIGRVATVRVIRCRFIF